MLLIAVLWSSHWRLLLLILSKSTDIDSRTSIKDLILNGEPPNNVMPRKCSLCKQRILDNLFACYKKLDPTRYVLHYLQDGCGSPGCPGKPACAWGIPADDRIPYVRPSRTNLKGVRKAEWSDFMLRTAEECERLPEVVAIKCNGCKEGTFQGNNPRWTVETAPRYVRRKPNCPNCRRRT